MYALYLFGPYVERSLGTTRFVVAYVTMAVASSVFVYWLTEPDVATIGASGAVFGLFGLALVLLIRTRQDVRGLLVLLAINAFISLQGNISWQGHLGGFVTGALLGAGTRLRSARAAVGVPARGVRHHLGRHRRGRRGAHRPARLIPPASLELPAP